MKKIIDILSKVDCWIYNQILNLYPNLTKHMRKK